MTPRAHRGVKEQMNDTLCLTSFRYKIQLLTLVLHHDTSMSLLVQIKTNLCAQIQVLSGCFWSEEARAMGIQDKGNA